VSQVRKDILNGWKEIGGYVCRDIRTVERWEKQRGLPVRRVPGAGRATVYALISELDEWLANSKPEDKEVAADGLAGEVSSEPVTQFRSVEGNAAVEKTAANGLELPPESVGSARGILTARRSLIAGATIAVAAGLICVLTWPLVRGHARIAAERRPDGLDAREKTTAAPYRSTVAGVDDLYLRGMYFYEQRTPESLTRSLDNFSEAIKKDANYAPAYAGLSDTYNLLREYSVMPDAEAYPKAREAAERAIALDPKLPQAHASLGFIDFFWAWDTVGAEREFKTALALDPSSVLAHHWYGSMLTHEGRYSEAIEQLDMAQRLEPTSVAVLSTRALALGLSGHRGEAVDMLQDVVNETPTVSAPHAVLAILSKMEPRDPARYLGEMRRVAELRHSDEMVQVAAVAESAYRTRGENAMWTSILSAEERMHPGAANRTFRMAEAEAALGRNDAAFTDLKLLERRRDPLLVGVIVEPCFLPLHRDPRFGQLVASMGLPPLRQ
jgi:tetratricopeptide (TPR) repeat protein